MIIFAKQASIDRVETREQLLALGITEEKHLTSRIKDKCNTGIIRATIANKEKAETLIRNEVKIRFSVFKAQYDVKVLHYYKCATTQQIWTPRGKMYK